MNGPELNRTLFSPGSARRLARGLSLPPAGFSVCCFLAVIVTRVAGAGGLPAPVFVAAPPCGDDSYSGFTTFCAQDWGPKATIQAAIDITVDGGVIQVLPGVYQETINFNGKSMTIMSTGGPGATTIMPDVSGVPVVTCENVAGPAELSGFTITGGAAAVGAGMYINNANPTVSNCVFDDNEATDDGGGMAVLGNSSPTITGCTFFNNRALGDSGGGMFNDGSFPNVSDCTFSLNTAARGAGLASFNGTSLSVWTCRFDGNVALSGNGGGLLNNASTTQVQNSAFTGNAASNVGGAIQNATGLANVTVVNTTMHENSAGGVGGGGLWNEGTASISNSILWANQPDQLDGPFGVSVAWVNQSSSGVWFDPVFVDEAAGNLQLDDCSPCIDAGFNDDVSPSIVTDLAGNPRFYDDAGAPDVGPPQGGAPLVDLGAFERQLDTPLHPSYVAGVPDWSQPTLPAGGPAGDATGPWRAWCVPTSSADVVGYYSELGVAGIGDGLAFPNTSVWPSSDFRDELADADGGRTDLGWYLNTNDLGDGGSGQYGGTNLVDVAQGLGSFFEAHLLAGHYVRNYGAPSTLWAHQLYIAFDTTCEHQARHDADGAFAEIMREIDSGRPLLGHWQHGNVVEDPEGPRPAQPGSDHEEVMVAEWGDPSSGDPETGEDWYEIDGEEGHWSAEIFGHTMTIVGYYLSGDLCNPHDPPVDAIIVLDNNDAPHNVRRPLVLPWDDAGNKWRGLTSFAPAILRYVDHDAVAGTNTGETWADAYTDLQTALADPKIGGVQPVEIWVAEGTYTPGGSRADTFALANDVAIYGGFTGSESIRDERSPQDHETVLSGDIGVGGDPSDNSYHVVTALPGTNGTAVLDGFTITGGNANGVFPDENGGGIIAYGSPTIRNCAIVDNSTTGGGGGMFSFASPTVVNSRFLGNTAGGAGGGVFNFGLSSSEFGNCAFSGNVADQGGGMYNASDTAPYVSNCTFAGNTAKNSAGGGIYNDSAPMVLANCILWGNTGFPVNRLTGATTGFSDVEFGSQDVSGPANIIADPLFADANGPDNVFGTKDDDLRLTAGSPCVDAGAVSELTSTRTDLDGEPRAFDHPLAPDCPQAPGQCGASPLVDMGAYERPCGPCSADVNLDGTVGINDFLDLIAAWGPCPNCPPSCPADINGDCWVDITDFLLLIASWGPCPVCP
jgi:parallel beta-helix repeat protein